MAMNGGSLDAHPERVPSRAFGARARWATQPEIDANLKAMRAWIAGGRFADDLPPKPPAGHPSAGPRIGDPGDADDWDPASCGSA